MKLDKILTLIINMAKKAETVFKERVRKVLLTLDNAWFVKTQQVVIRGTPDFLLCINGMFIAMELKATIKDVAKKPTLQSHNLEKINKANGIAFFVYPENWDQIFLILKTLSKGGHYDRTNMGLN